MAATTERLIHPVSVRLRTLSRKKLSAEVKDALNNAADLIGQQARRIKELEGVR